MQRRLSYLPKTGEDIGQVINAALCLANEERALVRTYLGGIPFLIQPGSSFAEISMGYHRVVQQSRRQRAS